ncbi:MAG: chlorophyllase [Micromonosporaceae bacterium]|nr:chlorophyllase [Micromonosporaceae bacterium]
MSLAGCTGSPAAEKRAQPAATQTAAAIAKPPAKPAPSRPFAVGTRTITTKRGDRVLRTTIWYPAKGKAGGAAKRGAKAASGKFPVVVFSHGLNGTPSDYRDLLAAWASAGFVVAGPRYPHTARGAAEFNLLDVVNQPTDAAQVLSAVLALGRKAGDPLRDHLDAKRVAAAGHSAGAITTVGLFTLDRDARFGAGVVLAGNAVGVGTDFAGPAAPLLFVHGSRDPLVSLASGRDVFDKAPWPKAFLTLPGADHAEPYLDPASPAWDVVTRTTTDFLRWSLYGDAAAKKRLSADARRHGLGELDDRL